jgi:hypothetical protein
VDDNQRAALLRNLIELNRVSLNAEDPDLHRQYLALAEGSSPSETSRMATRAARPAARGEVHEPHKAYRTRRLSLVNLADVAGGRYPYGPRV